MPGDGNATGLLKTCRNQAARGKADSDARTSPLLLLNVKAVVHEDDVPTWTSSYSPVASLSMRATLPLKPPSIESELPRRCLQVGRRRAEEIAPAESHSLAREASAHSLPNYYSAVTLLSSP
ncbi:unnamed protein product [Polarella glacialis]|uniref:Uncharacterized protein n=1 Tax=Polarella glacialis TaxID=89957 RepID=A0A813HTZ4_POLGL|nr:unnamed protein product [Polarella glacialis]CAE8616582.1 unnamed protein product [Polarella glacialis]CAE8641897.1 unnamed protein product [Polarella glacialis]